MSVSVRREGQDILCDILRGDLSNNVTGTKAPEIVEFFAQSKMGHMWHVVLR